MKELELKLVEELIDLKIEMSAPVSPFIHWRNKLYLRQKEMRLREKIANLAHQ